MEHAWRGDRPKPPLVVTDVVDQPLYIFAQDVMRSETNFEAPFSNLSVRPAVIPIPKQVCN